MRSPPAFLEQHTSISFDSVRHQNGTSIQLTIPSSFSPGLHESYIS